jgi:hypothetical protein
MSPNLPGLFSLFLKEKDCSFDNATSAPSRDISKQLYSTAAHVAAAGGGNWTIFATAAAAAAAAAAKGTWKHDAVTKFLVVTRFKNLWANPAKSESPILPISG